MNLQEANRPIIILLVEDNPGDIFLISHSLGQSQLPYNLYDVEDGQEAINFLRKKGEYASVDSPHLVLLDLNLPIKNGFEVLEEIKEEPSLKHLPVVILTSSNSEQDVLNSYRLYANCYVTKPFEVDEFSEVIKVIESFWANYAHLPLVS